MAIQQSERHVPHVEQVTTKFANARRTNRLISPPRRTSFMGEAKWSAAPADIAPQFLSRRSIFRPVAFGVGVVD